MATSFKMRLSYLPVARAAARSQREVAKLQDGLMFDWNDLKYFLAFARTGSMLAAAKALGVHQSTVQRRLTEFEDRLGQRLVTRHMTGYRLTALGEALRRSAIGVEASVGAFERDFSALKTDVVRVTTTGYVADRMRNSPLVDAFHSRNPDLRLELVVSDRCLDLARGEADLAIRAGEPTDDGLVGRKIADVPWAVYAARSYIERHGAPRCPEDIKRHFVVTCDDPNSECPGTTWLRSVAPRAKVAAWCDTGSEQVRFVRSGAGLAPLLAYKRDDEFVRVIDDIGIATPFYLLMHKDLKRTPRVRAFADFAASEFTAFRALVAG